MKPVELNNILLFSHESVVIEDAAVFRIVPVSIAAAEAAARYADGDLTVRRSNAAAPSRVSKEVIALIAARFMDCQTVVYVTPRALPATLEHFSKMIDLIFMDDIISTAENGFRLKNSHCATNTVFVEYDEKTGSKIVEADLSYLPDMEGFIDVISDIKIHIAETVDIAKTGVISENPKHGNAFRFFFDKINPARLDPLPFAEKHSWGGPYEFVNGDQAVFEQLALDLFSAWQITHNLVIHGEPVVSLTRYLDDEKCAPSAAIWDTVAKKTVSIANKDHPNLRHVLRRLRDRHPIEKTYDSNNQALMARTGWKSEYIAHSVMIPAMTSNHQVMARARQSIPAARAWLEAEGFSKDVIADFCGNT